MVSAAPSPELRASISSVASALLRSAVQRGERVVWLLPNGLEALQLSCACYQVGFPGKQWENGENPEGNGETHKKTNVDVGKRGGVPAARHHEKSGNSRKLSGPSVFGLKHEIT